jgi:uncharacterized protein with NRDE domain
MLAGNRDEYHARLADPIARWPELAPLLAGRDRLSGGTWLGISDFGCLAVVTNARGFEALDPGKVSRGRLASLKPRCPGSNGRPSNHVSPYGQGDHDRP